MPLSLTARGMQQMKIVMAPARQKNPNSMLMGEWGDEKNSYVNSPRDARKNAA
jgi:hypothetical protein